MRIALAQINSHLGEFEFNRKKILEMVERAKEWHCQLVVFPELALFGYPPADLLERDDIVKKQEKELKKLGQEIPTGISVLVGAITRNPKPRGRPYFNSAVLLEKGKKSKVFNKQLLPIYDVFDDGRHLERGQTSANRFTLARKKILVTVCEDIWGWDQPGTRNLYLENPLAKIREKFDLVVNLSASPFARHKADARRFVVAKTAKQFKAPMVYVNQAGAQDEIIFDGHSFAVNARGETIVECRGFAEDINILDLAKITKSSKKTPSTNGTELLRQALVFGIREFCEKVGITKVHLGLSGGIDSAVVACLAVDALGPKRVKLFALPGPFSDGISLELAKKMEKTLGATVETIDIVPLYKKTVEALDKALGNTDFGIMHENIQSRLRGLLLMAYSNRENSLLLSTGNKSEYATGYSTLYGDMCGALAPLGDLLKNEVYELAKHYNRDREVIPNKIISRAPSAELRPNQKDQDSLPAYDELDSAVRNIIEKRFSAKNKTEKWLLAQLNKSEFKRWQAPPILKISEHAFGRGRRMPIAIKGHLED